MYIDFNDFNRISKNIRFIIAFPDYSSDEIPKQKKVSLNSGDSKVKKIDLNKIIETRHSCQRHRENVLNLAA